MGDTEGDDWEKVREDWTRLAKTEYLKPNSIYDDSAQRRMATLIAREAVRTQARRS